MNQIEWTMNSKINSDMDSGNFMLFNIKGKGST